MNKELYMVLIPAVSWLLFSLGGTGISDTKGGWKGWRRYILPLVYLVLLLLAKVVWYKALGVVLLSTAAFSLGYSLHELYIFIAYGLISLPIGFSAWNIITPIACVVLFLLSNWKYSKNTFVWKIVEGCFGCLVGIQIAIHLL